MVLPTSLGMFLMNPFFIIPMVLFLFFKSAKLSPASGPLYLHYYLSAWDALTPYIYMANFFSTLRRPKLKEDLKEAFLDFLI